MFKKLKFKNKMENAREVVMKNIIRPINLSNVESKSKNKSEILNDMEFITQDKSENLDDMEFITKNKPETLENMEVITQDKWETLDNKEFTTKNKWETLENMEFITKNKPETSEDIVLKSNNKPETSEGILLNSNNKPETSEGILLKSNNKPETWEGVVLKSNNKPETSEDILLKSNNKPKTSEGIVLVSHNKPETSEGIVLVSNNKPETSEGIVLVSNNKPETAEGLLLKSNSKPETSEGIMLKSHNKLEMSEVMELKSDNTSMSSSVRKVKSIRKRGTVKKARAANSKELNPEKKMETVVVEEERILTNDEKDTLILLKLLENLDLSTQKLLMMNHEQLPIMLNKMWPNENALWILDLPKCYRFFGEMNMKPALETVNFNNIERIVYSLDCTKELYTFLSQSCENIQTFDILPSRNNDDSKVWPFLPLPKLLPNITILSVYIDVKAGYIQQFKMLRELTITKDINQNDLNEIFKNCTQLTELNLLTDNANLYLAITNKSKLQKLGVSIEVFKNNTEKIMNCRYLNTIGISHKKTSSTKDWIDGVNKIIALRGSFIYQIALTGKNIENNNWIKYFKFNECPQLSELELNDLKHLNNEAVLDLVERIPNLLFFTLKNSPLLTKELLQGIADKRTNANKLLDIESEGCPRFEAATMDPVDGILLKRHSFNFFTQFDAYTSEFNVTKFLLKPKK